MPTSAPTPAAPAAQAQRTPRVAIVCRDDDAGETVTTYIADMGLEPVISQEPRADASSSVETLEALRQADYALVLQTDRLVEIGFLLGALGRAKVCVLQSGDGADGLGGLTRHSLDDGGVWRLLLARQMKQAGLDVDLNRAM
jgi:predicted nucleotide-binding protein